jgi:hypothetical protein
MTEQGMPTFETARGDQVWLLPTLTAEQVRALPASFHYAWAARAWGLSRYVAKQLLASGGLPFTVVRMGKREITVRRADLMKSLGIAEAETGSEPVAPGSRGLEQPGALAPAV